MAEAITRIFTLVMGQSLMSGSARKIISRRELESLVIGDDIQVTVLEVGFSQVRLGLYCPRHDPPYWEVTLRSPTVAPAESQSELTLTTAARF